MLVWSFWQRVQIESIAQFVTPCFWQQEPEVPKGTKASVTNAGGQLPNHRGYG